MVALFRMKLHPKNIALIHHTIELEAIRRNGQRVKRVGSLEVVGMQEVEPGIIFETLEQGTTQSGHHVVPTHMWHWQFV